MLSRIMCCLLIGVIPVVCCGQRPAPNDPHAQAVRRLEMMLQQSGGDVDATLLAPEHAEELKQTVLKIRSVIKSEPPGDVLLNGNTDGELAWDLPSRRLVVRFELTETLPPRVKALSIADQQEAARPGPLTWESLAGYLDEVGKHGFSGVVCVLRDDEIAFQKAYGYANREKQIPNRVDTVFAIGSFPIDFTHAGILWHKDRQMLTLDDRITKFFDNVPADKQAITLRHLMTGRSGLPDFHGLPSDENQDHTWIDREEAVRRILNQELLFEPGKGRAHSHSAWGLLAAVIELCSDLTYPEFTSTHLFEPAGMQDTGFFGQPVAEDRIAVGYGYEKSSEPNAPPHWGPTSWLVMGSGGQISTIGDILRWERAIAGGKILSKESTRAYVSRRRGIGQDGNMFGFEFLHSYDPQSMFLLISNAVDSRAKREQMQQLGDQLFRLVQSSAAAGKYTLGIAMEMSVEADGEGRIIVQRVVPGSAADAVGFRPGDQLLAANGEKLDRDPLQVLDRLLETGNPIEFELQRGNQRLKIPVTPQRRTQ